MIDIDDEYNLFETLFAGTQRLTCGFCDAVVDVDEVLSCDEIICRECGHHITDRKEDQEVDYI